MKIPIPKQHGAWGMLYVPFLTAASSFGIVNAELVLTFFLLTLAFVLQEPLLGLIRFYPVREKNHQRFRFLLTWAILFAALLLLTVVILTIKFARPNLFLFGTFAALLLALHVFQQKGRTDRTIGGEFLSVLGLTLSAPVTCYVLTGRIDRLALMLWLFNIVYFTSSIFYVKLRVSRAANKKYGNSILHQCMIYHAILFVLLVGAIYARQLSAFILLAFLPILARSFWAFLIPKKQLNLRRIGLAEIVFSIIFLVFLSFGLR